jgi:DNA-binding NarL/FixJ family response regulator
MKYQNFYFNLYNILVNKSQFYLAKMIADSSKLPTTILIAEDDPMMQLGIKKMIESHTELKILAIVNNGQEAIQKTFELQPDLVLIDLRLPEIDGIEATRQIKTSLPNIKVMILTCQTEKEQVLTAFAGGADAYCIKLCFTHKSSKALLGKICR